MRAQAEPAAAPAAAERYRDLGFGLHYRNMRSICSRDVILPSIGGAGQALIGNVLVELNLHYVDLAKEVILPDGSSRAPTDPITRRLRPGSERPGRPSFRPWPRLMKTHLPAEEFEPYEIGAVWIVVRDPRDAIYSWYRYHVAFAEAEWERVPGTFEEFLARPFFHFESPVEAWSCFYRGWSTRAARCGSAATIRFEDVKRRPFETMNAALTAVGLHVPADELRHALAASSYDAMRRHEEAVARGEPERPRARIMRSGKVDGWRDWMTPDLETFFAGRPLASVARRFGYAI